jgi:hypothetical protein
MNVTLVDDWPSHRLLTRCKSLRPEAIPLIRATFSHSKNRPFRRIGNDSSVRESTKRFI